LGLFIAFGFDRPLKENLFSFVIAKFHNTHRERERERERKKERECFTRCIVREKKK